MSNDNIDTIAMFSDEVDWVSGETVFESDTKADFLFVLQTGEVEVRYKVKDTIVSDKSKEFYVCHINPGEPFGLSSVIEPNIYNAACAASQASQGIKIDAKKLLELAAKEVEFGYGLMRAVAKVAFERLTHVSQQLVAARK